jgi:hypothetical protein
VISSDHLKPGEIGRVNATVQTINISGPSLKHLSVYSNDLVTPVLVMEISINVVTGDAAPKGAAPTGVAPK